MVQGHVEELAHKWRRCLLSGLKIEKTDLVGGHAERGVGVTRHTSFLGNDVRTGLGDWEQCGKEYRSTTKRAARGREQQNGKGVSE